MKVCSKCKVEKLETEFYVKNSIKSRLHAQCKDCYKVQRKVHAQAHYEKYGDEYRKRALLRKHKVQLELRIKLFAYMADKSCSLCDESDIRALDFDHLNPSSKKFGISYGIHRGFKWETILEEINKCRILCSNCHRKHTATQFNWYKNIQKIE